MSDHLDDARQARKLLTRLRRDLNATNLGDLTHDELTDLWVACKQAANAAYSLCKDADRHLLAEAGKSRGWIATDGTPVEVKRRFETELLDEHEFAAWCANRGVSPFETKVAVTSEARDQVKSALLDDGESVPGVSAGFGAPFLSLGRRS